MAKCSHADELAVQLDVLRRATANALEQVQLRLSSFLV